MSIHRIVYNSWILAKLENIASSARLAGNGMGSDKLYVVAVAGIVAVVS